MTAGFQSPGAATGAAAYTLSHLGAAARFVTRKLCAAAMLCAALLGMVVAGLPGKARAQSSPAASPTTVPTARINSAIPGSKPKPQARRSAAPQARPVPPRDNLQPIAANPGAVNILPGTGLLGRLVGLDPASGIEVGGLWIGTADYLMTGGLKPGSWDFNSLLVLNLNLDGEKLIGLPGASVDAALLQFNGQPANHAAGTIPGYDGLTGPEPLVRTQLYELWWRQSLFADQLVVRVGKTIPTYDFNNVARAVPVADTSLQIPAVTGLIYTPIFKNPTLIGVSPGYYNSAYGITANWAPTRSFYLTYAVYDGALAKGIETGLQEAPVLDGHYFTIGEVGYAWALGERKAVGDVGVGGWVQTGGLSGPGAQQEGAQGVYAFGAQRLWRRHPGVDNSGVSGFFQFGWNDSRTMIAQRYFGLGLTGFGLIPNRPVDSIGTGLAWSWLNRNYGFRSNEAMLAAYYQAHLIGSTFFQPTLSYIPNPGHSPHTPPAVALTLQTTVLF